MANFTFYRRQSDKGKEKSLFDVAAVAILRPIGGSCSIKNLHLRVMH